MPQAITEIMARNPVTVEANTPVSQAARLMRDQDIGDVLIVEGGRVSGILTDRDIVVRLLAEQRDPNQATVGEVASRDLHVLSTNDTVDQAIQIVRQHAVRRIPVVDQQGRAAGIVSIGDLAIERDPHEALAEISAAPANN